VVEAEEAEVIVKAGREEGATDAYRDLKDRPLESTYPKLHYLACVAEQL
jgi:hypothetical protein